MAEWMSGRWWIALSCSLIIIMMVRSSTVGAPFQVGMVPASSTSEGFAFAPTVPDEREQIALELKLDVMARRLVEAKAALDTERTRSELLRESYDGLDEQFEQVTRMLRADSGTAVPAAYQREGSPPPPPAEAIYVRGDAQGVRESGSH